jgi:membrane associated rhomboid family serine protease
MLPLRDHLPTRTFPYVNYGLIAANVVVFLMQLSGTLGPGMGDQWMLHPGLIWDDPATGVETIFTSMFMHGGLAHIGGNMLFLWIFGDNVEDAMGHFRYVVFYLVGGLCAAGAQIAASPASMVPMLGASGAISAVLAAYVFLYPRSPITVLNPIPILWLFWGLFLLFPAWLVIGLFFLVNLWDALTMSTQGGVAFMAHVGGFVGGAVLYRLFLLGRERREDYGRHDQWVRPRRPRRVDYY